MIFETIGTIGLFGGGSVVGTARGCAISPFAVAKRQEKMRRIADPAAENHG